MFISLGQFSIFLDIWWGDIEDHLFLGLAVGIQQNFLLAIEDQLRFIVEVHLDHLVVQPKRDGLVGFRPSFNVHERNRLFFIANRLGGWPVEVFSEVLHEGQFLWDLLIVGTAGKRKGKQSLWVFAFVADVVHLLPLIIKDHFRSIIEVNSCRPIGEEIPEAILRRIIHPFFNIDRWVAIQRWSLLFGAIRLQKIVAEKLRIALQLVILLRVLFIIEKVAVQACRCSHWISSILHNKRSEIPF